MFNVLHSRTLTGAWIETRLLAACLDVERVAPSRVRGLKRVKDMECIGRYRRTLTGAWIETSLHAYR